MPFTKHGHPYGDSRPSDAPPFVARCGGPAICPACKAEVAVERATNPDHVEVLPEGFDPRESQWRVGRKLGRTIYAQTPEGGDFLVGMVESRELADHIVALQNREAF